MSPELWNRVRAALAHLETLSPEEAEQFRCRLIAQDPEVGAELQKKSPFSTPTRSPESPLDMEDPPDGPDRTNSYQPSSFEQVRSLCADFSADWEAEQRPDIPSYLAVLAEEARPTLLVNLLEHEIQKRRERGEVPRVDEYVAAMPNYASLIRGVFLESSVASSVHSAEEPLESTRDRESSYIVPAATRLGEYRLLRELGRGGMGAVYEAVHVSRGHRVALKTLPAVSGSSLHRFKREFRSAAEITHPNLIGLHTLECDGTQWFITMQLLEGTDFRSWVRPGGTLDVVRLRSALNQLIAGVMALHGAGIVHRDLKPGNVMVTDEGRVVVLDFGLVAELTGDSGSLEKVAGTPAYMAPEQGAGHKVSAPADWYAVGVMLYEALSGKRPFTAGDNWELLRIKQERDAPPLPEDPNIPGDLAALARSLLTRNPETRPDAMAIAGALSYVPADMPNLAASPVGPLIGRSQQQEALRSSLDDLLTNRGPVTVFIRGRSGEGKTALAEQFLAPLRADSALTVMSGRCYDRETVPFKALDTLIDALAGHLRGLPGEDAALLIPDDVGMLAQVFPVLQRVEVISRAGGTRGIGVADQQIRQRAFRALRSLLIRLGRATPIVWFVDDLQWGDADSAEALFEVLRPPEAPPLMFVGTFRSDEADESPFLLKWAALQKAHAIKFDDREVTVGPLSREECVELVVRITEQDAASVRAMGEHYHAATGGNPFLLTELASCFDPESGTFGPAELPEVIARKLAQLSSEATGLLEVVSVSGQALPLAESSQAAGYTVLPMDVLTHMRNGRLLRIVGSEDSPRVDTYHDKIRETVLDGLVQERRSDLHLTLAQIIEAAVGAISEDEVASIEAGDERQEDRSALERVYDLAFHFDAAGEQRKALAYSVLAAEQARRQYALDVAVSQFSIAKRNAQTAANGLRYRIGQGFGEVLILLGRYEEADRELRDLPDLTDDPERKARIEMLQGELAFKQGHLNKSIGHYTRGLRRLGVRVPQTLLGLGWGIFRGSLTQFWHGLLPGRLFKKPTSGRDELVIRFCARMEWPCSFTYLPTYLWLSLTGLNRAERLVPSDALAFMYTLRGNVLSSIGWHSRALRYFNRASELRQTFDDLWGQGVNFLWKAVGFWAAGQYERGIETFSKAIDCLEKTGDLSERLMAHFHLGCCHYSAGNLVEALEEARRVFDLSVRLGDARANCSLYLWSKAAKGNLPFDQLRSCFTPNPEDILSTCNLDKGEGYWLLAQGRTAEAVEAFERACSQPRKHRVLIYHTVDGPPGLAMALRQHADTLQSHDPSEARKVRKRGLRAAKRASLISWFWPIVRAFSLRELALAYQGHGKTRKALKYADKSLAVAQKQRAKYEHAKSLLVRGRLAKELGLPEADDQIAEAEAAIEAIEAPVRQLLAQQENRS